MGEDVESSSSSRPSRPSRLLRPYRPPRTKNCKSSCISTSWRYVKVCFKIHNNDNSTCGYHMDSI